MLLCLSLLATLLLPAELVLTVAPTGPAAWTVTGRAGDSPVTGLAMATGPNVFLGLTRWPAADPALPWGVFAPPVPLTVYLERATLTGTAISEAVASPVQPCPVLGPAGD